MSRASEVTFGESQEKRILRRWMRLKGIRADKVRVLASRAMQDWDFLLLDQSGFPVGYVEIKMRRSALVTYGDAIAPWRKHRFAIQLRDIHKIPFVMVTEYPDALVEVDLADPPARQRSITRRDRGGDGVLHGIWEGAQLSVLEGGD